MQSVTARGATRRERGGNVARAISAAAAGMGAQEETVAEPEHIRFYFDPV